MGARAFVLVLEKKPTETCRGVWDSLTFSPPSPFKPLFPYLWTEQKSNVSPDTHYELKEGQDELKYPQCKHYRAISCPMRHTNYPYNSW